VNHRRRLTERRQIEGRGDARDLAAARQQLRAGGRGKVMAEAT